MCQTLDDFVGFVLKSREPHSVHRLNIQALRGEVVEGRLDRVRIRGVRAGLFVQVRADQLVASKRTRGPDRTSPPTDFLSELLQENRKTRAQAYRTGGMGHARGMSTNKNTNGNKLEALDDGFVEVASAELKYADAVVAELMMSECIVAADAADLEKLLQEGLAASAQDDQAAQDMEADDTSLVMRLGATNGGQNVEALEQTVCSVPGDADNERWEAPPHPPPAAVVVGGSSSSSSTGNGNSTSNQGTLGDQRGDIDFSALCQAYGLKEKLPDIFDAITGVCLGKIHTINGSVKATCKQAGHGPCVLWISGKNSPVASAMADAWKWLSQSRVENADEHWRSGLQIKKAHGMKISGV